MARHAQAARGAYASNTERALRADTAVFTAWCAETGLVSLPAAPETNVAFVDFTGEIKAPATVRRYVSSIATFHRAAGLANPCTDDIVRYGVELPAVMQSGGWKSPAMVARYTARLDARRGGAAKLAMLQNRT